MAFRAILVHGLVCARLLVLPDTGEAQVGSLRGEASVGAAASTSADAGRELRLRYLPEWSGSAALSSSLTLDALTSANLWTSRLSPEEGSGLWEDGAEPYRVWVRLSAPRFELRAGLQKIAFGSATVFRPLMWFDRVDPRDPLQLSQGVWGVLSRLYLPGNVTAWAWGIVGEDDRKGWEVLPTGEGAVEGGGRLQIPFGPGEVAATYHRRRFDLTALGPVEPSSAQTGDEDRFAFDGRWDLDFGFWLEAALIRRDSEAVEQRWTHAWSVGADYTLVMGNGLSVLAEHLDQESPTFLIPPDPGQQEVSGPGTPDGGVASDPPTRVRLTSFTANYPLGVLDRLALAVYRDWEGRSWLRLAEWRRTYDRWRFHLLAFWNPGRSAVFPTGSRDDATRSGTLAGKGAQLIVVFNH